jgi:hypothetical protein
MANVIIQSWSEKVRLEPLVVPAQRGVIKLLINASKALFSFDKRSHAVLFTYARPGLVALIQLSHKVRSDFVVHDTRNTRLVILDGNLNVDFAPIVGTVSNRSGCHGILGEVQGQIIFQTEFPDVLRVVLLGLLLGQLLSLELEVPVLTFVVF